MKGVVNNMTSSLPKPYDIGNTILAASVSQCGRIISVNRAHHSHGYIKLTPVEPFDNAHWYDPEIVREYRNSFLSDETQEKGYGISFSGLPTTSGFGELRFAGNENILFQEYCSDGVAITRSFFIPPQPTVSFASARLKITAMNLCHWMLLLMAILVLPGQAMVR